MKRPIDAVLDIETDIAIPPELYEDLVASVKPDARLKDRAKIAADIEKKRAAIIENAALAPVTARIVSIAVAFVQLGDDGEVVERSDWSATVGDTGSETALLLAFIEALAAVRSEASRFRIVTYNGRRFDVPFLAARIIANEVDGHRLITNDRRTHLDLVDVLPGGLKRWGIVLGQPLEGDGRGVRALVEEERWSDLRAYNVADVDLTVELWRRASRAVAW